MAGGGPEISPWIHLEFTKTFLCLTLWLSGNILNTWKISLIISAKGAVGNWCRGTGPFSLFVPQPGSSCPPEMMTLTRVLSLHDNPRATRGELSWGWVSSPIYFPWTLAAHKPSTWFDMRSYRVHLNYTHGSDSQLMSLPQNMPRGTKLQQQRIRPDKCSPWWMQGESSLTQAQAKQKWEENGARPVVRAPLACWRNTGRLCACTLRGNHSRKQLFVLFPRF